MRGREEERGGGAVQGEGAGGAGMTGARGDAIYPRIYARVRWGCEARECRVRGAGARGDVQGQGARGPVRGAA